MEEFDTPSPEFVKGFNEGYTIAQHMPELAEQLSSATLENERGAGFKAGRQQDLAEREQQREPDWRRGKLPERPRDQAATKQRDLDKEHERDR